MDIGIFDNIKDKKFSAFEDAVSKEFRSKFTERPEIQQYRSDYDKLQSMKAAFAKISDEFSTKDSTEV